MVNALHADQWLENHPETAAAERDAFYTDTGAWQQRTVEQGVDAARQAVAGLAG